MLWVPRTLKLYGNLLRQRLLDRFIQFIAGPLGYMEEFVSDDREQRVREQALNLWEVCGRPERRDTAIWLEAERQIASSERPEPGRHATDDAFGPKGSLVSADAACLPLRNVLINGAFAINQRRYSSGAKLPPYAYAHDRWKAGAIGCAYTFEQDEDAETAITIVFGWLMQAVERVYAPAMWLTWVGTASARVTQGLQWPPFSTGTEMTVGGVTMNALHATDLKPGQIIKVEFSNGTLGLVQLEAAAPGAEPQPFERRLHSTELALCQRYFQIGLFTCRFTAGAAGENIESSAMFSVPMRAPPKVAEANALAGQAGNRTNVSSVTLYTSGGNLPDSRVAARFNIISAGAGDAYAMLDAWSLDAEL